VPNYRLLWIALLALTVLPDRAAHSAFPGTMSGPDGKGDQVIFYYDARDHFTTFINLRNESASKLTVSVLFYDPDFSAPFSQIVTLPAGALTIFDTSMLRANGLPAQFGVAIATAVDGSGAPIVTRALSGNFTVANLLVQSAWGAAGAARSAVEKSSTQSKALQPDPGSVIDGTSVALMPIQSASADLSAYYDPETLAPVSEGGNQLIFLAFEDVPGSPYTAKLGSTTWTVAAVRSTGTAVAPTTFVAKGVTVSDLASVAGAAVNGASGAVSFSAAHSAAPLTRLVFFTETLGTFGTGYLLPRGRPATPAPTPVPTPTT
jgi:hypothetical protein